MSAQREPEQIYRRARDEGRRRLARPVVELAATALVGGFDVAFGVPAYALAAAAIGGDRGRVAGAIAFVGYDGGRVAAERLADHVVVTPSEHIPRLQEAQATGYHVLRELVEA